MNFVVHYVCPPIPIRSYDWCARIEGREDPGDPIGYGNTREAAIEDLKEQLEDLEEAK